MIKTIYFISAVLILFSVRMLGQTGALYMPLDMSEAYKKGTRSFDGKPGENYWQNHSDYKIKAELIPDSSKIIGQETITYFNNSPDTLKAIVIRLYPDILKKGSARDWYLGTQDLHDGVNISNFIINGDTIDLSQPRRGVFRGSTNIFLRLNNSIPPGGKAEINIDWSFYLPQYVTIRMGNYGDGDFFVAYWYPQISVYDDIDGWDFLEYEGSVEFYNDFNNYDFEISVPREYVIWATGELQNHEEVFNPNIINKIAEANESDSPVKIISAEDYKNNGVTKDNKINTWKFKAEKVTDVSFCVSDNFVWDAASIEVDPGRRVLTSAVYKDSTIHWNEAAGVARATIEYLSFDIPGYPYPYSHTTSFCNGGFGGGMETPMMANDGAPRERASSVGLVFHEVSHSYLPFFMGTNERKYAWMDEGWATFFPRETVLAYEPDSDPLTNTTLDYESYAGKESELPPMILSYSNTTDAARISIYNRPAVAYNALMELLGKDLFKKALCEYIERWHEKHPIPYDFFFTFNDVAKEDLSWFWKPWFFDFGYPDLAIKNVSADDKQITVEKIGGIPIPIKIKITFSDGSTQDVFESARIWKDGKKEAVLKYSSDKAIKKVELGDLNTPDTNRKDNTYEL